MAIQNTVFINFVSAFFDSINVLDCCLSGVLKTSIIVLNNVNILLCFALFSDLFFFLHMGPSPLILVISADYYLKCFI